MKDPERHEDVELDAAVRRSLDPHPAAVQRIVRNALADPSFSPHSPQGAGVEASGSRSAPRWMPRLAAAGLATAAAALVAVLSLPHAPTAVVTPPPPIETPAAHARLTISNTTGNVTISSSAGTQWIIQTGEPRS